MDTLDIAAGGWVIWWALFGLWEWWGVHKDKQLAKTNPERVDAPHEGHTLSALTRRIAEWHPVIKFAMAGAWVWFGIHIFFPETGL